MQPRKTILGMLGGGALLGVLMGLAADPEMVPPPEPTWRKVAPDPIFTEAQRFASTDPQYAGSAWSIDRVPTWKRRPAGGNEAVAYVPWEDVELPPEPDVATDAIAVPPPAAAAESETPALDAGAAVGPATHALTEPEPLDIDAAAPMEAEA